MKAANYDAIVIGTGQSGPYVSSRLAAVGMKVAVIDKVFAGTCVNTGCIPTKTMVATRTRRAWPLAAPSTASTSARCVST